MLIFNWKCDWSQLPCNGILILSSGKRWTQKSYIPCGCWPPVLSSFMGIWWLSAYVSEIKASKKSQLDHYLPESFFFSEIMRTLPQLIFGHQHLNSSFVEVFGASRFKLKFWTVCLIAWRGIWFANLLFSLVF